MFGFATYEQCRFPVSTLFAPRQTLLHMESVECLDLLKIFSRNRKNRTEKKKKNTLQPLTVLRTVGEDHDQSTSQIGVAG